jgi:DNA-binding MarR family transcriptional regulator
MSSTTLVAPLTGRDAALERLLDGLLKLSGTMAARSRAWGGEDGILSRGDLSVLGTLGVKGPMRPGVLAAHLQVGAPVMSRQVAALAADGLLERRPDPADGRAELVSLTDAGRARLLRARQAICARLAERVVPRDEAWLGEASAYVEELVAALNAQPEPLHQHEQKEVHV